MSQTNDCILDALGPGQVNDLLLLYYQAGGATAGQINDAEYQYLVAQGATPAHVNDMWFELLRGLGFEGALSDMLNAYWCGGPAVTPYFQFNGDGVIVFPGVSFDCTKPSVIEYTMERTDVATANMDMWGFDDGSTYGRLRELDFRLFRGGSGANFVLATYERNILYDVEERMEIAGALTVNVRLHGSPDIIATDGPRVVGAVGVRNALQIGGRVGGFGMVGRISDFKITSDLGLIHHWPIDEGSGTVINDIVGTATGTLDPGTGTWVPAPAVTFLGEPITYLGAPVTHQI